MFEWKKHKIEKKDILSCENLSVYYPWKATSCRPHFLHWLVQKALRRMIDWWRRRSFTVRFNCGHWIWFQNRDSVSGHDSGWFLIWGFQGCHCLNISPSSWSEITQTAFKLIRFRWMYQFLGPMTWKNIVNTCYAHWLFPSPVEFTLTAP